MCTERSPSHVIEERVQWWRVRLHNECALNRTAQCGMPRAAIALDLRSLAATAALLSANRSFIPLLDECRFQFDSFVILFGRATFERRVLRRFSAFVSTTLVLISERMRWSDRTVCRMATFHWILDLLDYFGFLLGAFYGSVKQNFISRSERMVSFNFILRLSYRCFQMLSSLRHSDFLFFASIAHHSRPFRIRWSCSLEEFHKLRFGKCGHECFLWTS